MKRVVSVSLGSSRRDHKVEVNLLNEHFLIERLGTDGSLVTARKLISALDSKVSAIGLGGIDLYLIAGGKKYVIRDARYLAKAAKITPVVDGSGLKHTLERETIKYLEEKGYKLSSKKVLVVSGVDRFGMAEAFCQLGSNVIFGDLMFALKLPFQIKITSLKSLQKIASLLLPLLCNLPFELLYPTGKRQEKITPRYQEVYQWADVIAGDFLLIKKFLPPSLPDKMIITNTTTKEDVELLRKCGVKYLVTTTPEFEGRSFGTNVMEAVLVALANSSTPLEEQEYYSLLQKLNWTPRIAELK